MKKTLIIILSGVGLLLLLILSGITIPLDYLDSQFESAASRLLDRKVEIQGAVRLRTSLHPSIELGRISVSNPHGWPEDGNLIAVDHSRIQLSLLALFRGEFLIDELEFEGVDMQLVTLEDNSTNYQFAFLDTETDESAARFTLSGVGNLNLRKVQIVYRDESGSKDSVLKIDEALGKGLPGNSLQLSAQGEVLGKSYSLELSGDSLAELIQGTSAWSITRAQLKVASAVMDISGTMDSSGQALAGQLSVSITGDDVNEASSMFGYSLPESGGFSVRAEINIQSDVIRFDSVELTALDSSMGGIVSYNYGDEHPVLRASLSIPEIDTKLLTSFLDTGASANPSSVTEQKNTQADSTASLSWEMLKVLDTDFNLHVGRLQHDSLQVQDIKVGLTLTDGDLSLPVSFMYDGVPTSGKFTVETSGGLPEAAFSLTSESMAIAPLLKVLAGEDKFSGQTGSVFFDGSTRGKGIQDLVKNFTVNLQLAGTSLSTDAGQLFAAKALSLEYGAGGIFVLSGQGEYLERPYNVMARSDPSATSNDGVSFKLDLNACDSSLKLRATSYTQRQDSVIDYNFSLSGTKLCSYLGPLEEYIGKDADFYSTGKGQFKNDAGSLVLETLRLGQIVVDAKAKLGVNAQGEPLLTVDVHGDRLDLSPFLNGNSETGSENMAENAPDAAAQSSQEKNAAVLDALLKQEVLPHLHFFKSADVNFHLEELIIGQGQVSNLRLSTKMREGTLTDAPFQATIVDELFTGNVRMDLAGKKPFVHIELTTNDFHLPALLQEFGIEESPDLTADYIEILLEFKGKNLGEMLQHNSQVLIIKGGKWQVDRVFGEPLQIDIKQAGYESRPDTPVRINIEGYLDNQPLTIELTEDGFLGKQYSKPMTLAVLARLADTELRLEGKFIRKLKLQENVIRLHSALSGDSMNSLNDILGINLPPLGPYRVEGSLEIAEKTARLHDMLLQIGDSVLRGEVTVHTTENEAGELNFPINVATRLDAERVQLDDFQLGDWSALSRSPDPAPESNGDKPGQDSVEEEDEGTLSSLVTPEVAEKLNGSLEVKVQQVLSGTDNLGSGTLSASLENGIYTLDRLQLDIPGGSVFIQGSLQPETDWIRARLDMQVNQLDYGVLVRRTQPDSDLKGRFNLNLALDSEAESPAAIKGNLNGHLQFGVIPEEYKSGVIDLWAVNILTAALPVLMKGSKSEVNCLAGDFTLINGIMEPKLFMLDTSRIRVEGKGAVNLKTDTIDFHLLPTPKSAHFFSAATPVSISGTIFKPDIGVSVGSVIATVFRMTSSLVTTPFMKIFMRELDPDGQGACDAAMEWIRIRDE